jgi:hypothetical protein
MPDLHELATKEDPASHGTSAVLYVFPWKGLRILPSACDVREASTRQAGGDPGAAKVDRAEMTETLITLKVTHKKPLPESAVKAIEQRFYSYCFSQGVEVGVTATLAELPKEPGREDK